VVCFKLIKWTALGLVGAVGGGYLVFGDHAVSYLGTAASSVRESVRGKIPVEFELKRAERLVAEIEPQIDTCKRDVARAEVELVDLDQQIEELGGVVTRQERKLRAGREVLASEQSTASYEAGTRLSDLSRVEMDLSRTLEAHRGNVALLRGKTALRDRQAQAVEAARSRLDSVRNQKGRLEDQIASLKVQKRELDAMTASSHRFDLDDSALSKAKEVLSRVKTELDIAQKVVEDDLFHAGRGNGPVPTAAEIVKEIDQFFAEGSGEEGRGKLVPRAVTGANQPR
jgi:chromosome segregation ATPase